MKQAEDGSISLEGARMTGHWGSVLRRLGQRRNVLGREGAAASVAGALFAYCFLLYAAATSGFGREFARLHVTVAGVPLFTGELAIALLLTLGVVHLWKTRTIGIRFDRTAIALLAFLLVGCVYAAVGLGRGFGLAALRDFALVYYLVFFFLTLAYLQQGGSVVRLVTAMVVGTTAGSALANLRFLVAPALSWEHAAPGYLALTAWLAVVWSLLRLTEARRATTRVLAGCAVLVCSVAIYLSAYRTMLVVVVAGIIVFGASAFWLGGRRALVAPAAAAAWLLLMTVVATVLARSMTDANGPLPAHGPTTVAHGLTVVTLRWVHGLRLPRPVQAASSEEVATRRDGQAATRTNKTVDEFPDGIGFRERTWSGAIAKIQASPLTGIGFGPAAALHPDRDCELFSSPFSNCGNAHNSYLTLAMRMGIPVFIFFVAINVWIVGRFLAALHRRPDRSATGALPAVLLTAFASQAVFAFTGLFFESPYLSTLYWVLLASIAHLSSAPTVTSLDMPPLPGVPTRGNPRQ